MSLASDDTSGRPRRRRMEIFAFLFLTAVLMPALAVATVGSYGLAVWIYSDDGGPAGPAGAMTPAFGGRYIANVSLHFDRRALISGRLLEPDRVVSAARRRNRQHSGAGAAGAPRRRRGRDRGAWPAAKSTAAIPRASSSS